MDALELLRRGLSNAEPVLDPVWAVPTQRVLEHNLAQLKAWARGEAKRETPAEEVIVVALKEFWQRQKFSTAGHARYVCMGCTQEFGEQRMRLIEDALRFPKALSGLESFLAERRRFRRCYEGLLHSFLLYDPEQAGRPAGKANWFLLRTFLANHSDALHVAGTVSPAWAEAAHVHSHLFTDRACVDFAKRALEGDAHPFEEMRSALAIAQQSWVTRRFVLSQIQAVAKKSDREFKERLPYLLRLLAQYPDYADDGLALLLERHCASVSVEVDLPLRDVAVSRWQNPWLETNARKWGRVSERVRQTIAGWLKVKLMRDFFSLLSDEGTHDKRRLEFWLRHIDLIEDMHFALGNEALSNRSADFVQLRNEMSGRLLGLHRAGQPRNNAFVMSVGDHLIIEFGEKGNACFVFDKRKSLPFVLEPNTYVAGDSTELKHQSFAWRLLHIDRSAQTWEEQFSTTLAHVLGGAPARATRPAPTGRGRVGSAGSRESKQRPGEFSEIEFARWIADREVEVRDQRARGGALWVSLPRESAASAQQLREWGFKFHADKAAWWLS